MEFLLINHPLDCPVCDKGGECPLQNQAMSNGRGESRFADGGVKRTFPKPINISAQVLLDRERCVLCARCTRFSEQIAGDPFIALIERGALQQVGIYENEPFESYFSGNTIQICPVGALTSAEYRFRSRPFDLVSTPVGRRARRLRRRDPGRPPARQGDAPPRRQRPRGQRGVDHRQGPLRVPLRHQPTTGSPTRWSATTTASCGPRRGPRRSPSPPAASRGAGRRRRADRRPAHRRGRLRLQQVRPGRARHQRHRLPGPPALRRGGRRSSPPRSRSRRGGRPTPTSSPPATVVLAGLEPEDEAGTIFLRLRKAVRAAGRHARGRARAVHLPRPAQDGRPPGRRPRPATRRPRSRRCSATATTASTRPP